jgi:hypothetical protein
MADTDRNDKAHRVAEEKRGGYPSAETPISSLPKVPAGPAPGAGGSNSSRSKK